jgi:hypothetical protein
MNVRRPGSPVSREQQLPPNGVGIQTARWEMTNLSPSNLKWHDPVA